ncbi:MAG TPA: hypothetical protein PLB11_09385 [Flavobacterium sp.]|nr:hypothetical protein [Flavobacterium sp.]
MSGEAQGDVLIDIENLHGSKFNDDLRGDAGANTLWGSEGNDILNGRIGNDILSGGSGADSFIFARTFDQDRIIDFENNIDTIRLQF